MIESPLIQEILAKRMHKDILRFLKARFGPIPAETALALEAIEDEAKLEDLVDLAASCPRLEDFQAKISS